MIALYLLKGCDAGGTVRGAIGASQAVRPQNRITSSGLPFVPMMDARQHRDRHDLPVPLH